ncbi:MAG TPA: hypothetical protein VKH43_08415 [Thermoanaerobaculia bacterium]|nr:hypothetical protein [Thermoanaerobaculia bacterium]
MPAVDHGSLLEKLKEKFRVFLVNRFADPRLGFGGDPVLRAVIPDLHWISADRAARYPDYHFDGSPLFLTLFEILRRASNLEVYQTGDRLDFWRMGDPGESPDEIYQKIFGDPDVSMMNMVLADSGATIVRGNHDAPLEDLTDPANTRPDRYVGAGGRFFLTHGNIWDQLERLPDRLQWGAVLKAEHHHAGTYQVGPFTRDPEVSIDRQLLLRRATLDRTTPIVLPARTGAVPISTEADVAAVSFAHVPISRFDDGRFSGIDDFQKTSGIVDFGGAIRAEARARGGACRLFLVSHTHWPRILVDEHPAGGPLVTMDCGAWIENSTILGEPAQRSHSIGVQFADEVRIYQLAPR